MPAGIDTPGTVTSPDAYATCRQRDCPGRGRSTMTRLSRLSTTPARRALTDYARERRLSLEELADVLHLDFDVRALIDRRWLPWHLADQVAVALGHHPYELWPEWFDEFDDQACPGEGATA